MTFDIIAPITLEIPNQMIANLLQAMQQQQATFQAQQAAMQVAFQQQQ